MADEDQTKPNQFDMGALESTEHTKVDVLVPEVDACYCTGTRHRWGARGGGHLCPAERVAAENNPALPPEPKYVLVGDMICIEVDTCTCGVLSGTYGHEPYCGIEPHIRLDEIRDADVSVEYGARPHDERAHRRWQETDVDIAKQFAADHGVTVETRFVLSGRF